ncbi:hypothetical protein MCEMRE26_00046 [Candidatus Nanopelagicaceae bacterium]
MPPLRARIQSFASAKVLVSALPLVLFFLVRQFQIPNYDSIGILPYKDANAWRLCAKSLALTGVFPDGSGNWCYRRPLFAEVSSILFKLLHSDTAVLAAYTLLFAVSIFFLLRELEFLFGLVPQVAVLALVFFLWLLFGLNLFLSEALGIPLGVIFTAFMLRFLRTNSLISISAAAFAISMLQNLRPSNVFFILIPLLCLSFTPFLYKRVAVVILATIAPFGLTVAAGKLLRIPEYNNAGNAWATLYGLLNNNSDWTLAYNKVGSLMDPSDYGISMAIKKITLEDLWSHPFNLFSSLLSNLGLMSTSHHPFFLPDNLHLAFFGRVFSLTLMSVIVWSVFRKPSEIPGNRTRVIYIFAIVTSLLFYSAYWRSEGPRVLSSLIPFTVIVAFMSFFRNQENRSEFTEVGVRQRVVLAPLIILGTIVFSLSTIVVNHAKVDYDAINPPLKCATNEFFFIEDSLLLQHTKTLKFFNLYEWEKTVKQLPDGFLILGVGKSDQGFISIRAFAKKSISANTCYRFNSELDQSLGLTALDFRYIK